MDNPFDQFASDFRAAIPGAPAPAVDDGPFSFAPPAPIEKEQPRGPVMNSTPQPPAYGGGPMNGGANGNYMQQQPPQQQQQMRGPMYGGPPPGAMNGAPPAWGGPPQGGMGHPPQPGMSNALVMSQQPTNQYAGMLGGPPGAPPAMNGGWNQQPPPQNQWGQQAPPQMGGPPPGHNGGHPQGRESFSGGPPGHPQGRESFSGNPAMGGMDGMFGAPSGPPPGAPAPAPPSNPDMGLGDVWGAPPPAAEQEIQVSQYGGPPPPVPTQSPPTDPFGYGGPPAPQQPYEQPPAPPVAQVPDSFMPAPLVPPPPHIAPAGGFGGLFDAPAAAAPAQYNDPWGGGAAAPAPSNAIVPSSTPSDDPFGIFGGNGPPAAAPLAPVAPAPVAAPVPVVVATPVPQGDGGDGWGDMFGDAAPAPAAAPVAMVPQPSHTETTAIVPIEKAVSSTDDLPNLPPGGEWYDARIFTPTLGVMFFKPQELTDSLFLQTDPSIVQILVERPVVAFIVEGSSARSAGVELGHVLLKVNGIDVRNPKEASRLIKEGPRPLPLLFYVPETTVVVAEGEHMVKYDTRETGAPPSAKDWKPKYAVIGGIIAQPWMMNMYRSKSEYDIAVIETQARRPVSVKVKQFSLQGARVQNDWQGPQMVKYKNKLHPWKFIVVLPVGRNPIKVSSPNLSQLKPVHEGIRRVLTAQQRGGGGPTAAPIRKTDGYDKEGGVGGQRRRVSNH